jgi:hypothetical protein
VITIVGCVADSLGAASQWVTVPAHHRGRNFDVKRQFPSTPSTEYRSVQVPEIAVDVNHDGTPIGTVRYLERTASKLFVVCEIDASGLGEGPWAYSPWIRHFDGKEIELLGLSVTRRPAQIGIGHLDAFPGPLHEAAAHVVYQDGHAGALVKRARDYDRHRKHGQAIMICSPPRLLPEPRFDSYVRVAPASGLKGRAVVPQARAGWRPGQLECSGHRGRVISVR